VHDPIADLINDILNEPPEPQPDTAGVFSYQEEEQEDSDYGRDPVYRKVPTRKNQPECGMCRKRLKACGTHWYFKDEDGEVYWWCHDCMAFVNWLPDIEEIKRAEENP